MPYIININKIFFNCSSLLSLPDISKWNLKNVISINNIFKGCSSLLSFPNICKWDFQNIKDNNTLNNFIEESSSSKYSSIKENSNFKNSDNINSSTFLNNQGNQEIININEYKVEFIDFSLRDDSLISYYDNFYS